MRPIWSILIPTVSDRMAMFDRLARELDRQCTPHLGLVVVLADRDDGTAPVGDKRTRLVEAATSEYVSFVDDDDWVTPDYVSRILQALDQGPDYVGFRVAYSVDGILQKPVIHDFYRGGWSETATEYVRDVSHLNPIRRSIALAALPFRPGFGEDHAYADRVRDSELITTASFVDKVLYEYRYSTTGSLFAVGARRG